MIIHHWTNGSSSDCHIAAIFQIDKTTVETICIGVTDRWKFVDKHIEINVPEGHMNESDKFHYMVFLISKDQDTSKIINYIKLRWIAPGPFVQSWPTTEGFDISGEASLRQIARHACLNNLPPYKKNV